MLSVKADNILLKKRTKKWFLPVEMADHKSFDYRRSLLNTLIEKLKLLTHVAEHYYNVNEGWTEFNTEDKYNLRLYWLYNLKMFRKELPDYEINSLDLEITEKRIEILEEVIKIFLFDDYRLIDLHFRHKLQFDF